LADVAGYGTYFDPHPESRFSFSETGPVHAVREALKDAGLSARDVNCWAGYGNATKVFDEVESGVQRQVFSGHASPAQMQLSNLIGETFSASGALRMALLLGRLGYGIVAGYSPMGSSSALALRVGQATSPRPVDQGARRETASR